MNNREKRILDTQLRSLHQARQDLQEVIERLAKLNDVEKPNKYCNRIGHLYPLNAPFPPRCLRCTQEVTQHHLAARAGARGLLELINDRYNLDLLYMLSMPARMRDSDDWYSINVELLPYMDGNKHEVLVYPLVPDNAPDYFITPGSQYAIFGNPNKATAMITVV